MPNTNVLPTQLPYREFDKIAYEEYFHKPQVPYSDIEVFLHNDVPSHGVTQESIFVIFREDGNLFYVDYMGHNYDKVAKQELVSLARPLNHKSLQQLLHEVCDPSCCEDYTYRSNRSGLVSYILTKFYADL